MTTTFTNKTFYIEHAALTAACAMLTRVIERRTIIPVLACVFFDGEGAIIATDLDIEFRVELEGEFSHPAFAVPLTDIVKAIKGAGKGSLVTLTYSQEAEQEYGVLRVMSDGLETDIDTLPEADFPIMITPTKLDYMTVTTDKVLRDALSFVRPAVSKEETRYYLNGVFFTSYNDKLTVVATDGHKLGKYETKVSAPRQGVLIGEGTGVILPTKAVDIARSTIAKTEDSHPIRLSFYEGKTEILGVGWSMVAKNVDGTFPDWTRVTPAASKNTILVNRLEFIKRVTRVSNVNKYPPITITTSDDGETVELGVDKSRMELPTIEMEGNFTSAFTSEYLISAARVFQSDELFLSSRTTGDPMAITATPHGREALFVVMPRRR